MLNIIYWRTAIRRAHRKSAGARVYKKQCIRKKAAKWGYSNSAKAPALSCETSFWVRAVAAQPAARDRELVEMIDNFWR